MTSGKNGKTIQYISIEISDNFSIPELTLLNDQQLKLRESFLVKEKLSKSMNMRVINTWFTSKAKIGLLQAMVLNRMK